MLFNHHSSFTLVLQRYEILYSKQFCRTHDESTQAYTIQDMIYIKEPFSLIH